MSDTAVLSRSVFGGVGGRIGGRGAPTGWRPTPSRDRTLPIRIPVTPGNRRVLRELRARELELWEAGDADGRCTVDVSAERETRWILVVLATATAAAVVWLLG